MKYKIKCSREFWINTIIHWVLLLGLGLGMWLTNNMNNILVYSICVVVVVFIMQLIKHNGIIKIDYKKDVWKKRNKN